MEISEIPKEENKVSEEALINERKEKIINYFKSNYNWIIYVILAAIVYLSIKIRTSNIPLLKDITTGDWALGPDLDPWLFLRWAKYIVANGSLFAVDKMRYAPFGAGTEEEYLLHPYMIAWFHKFLSFFGLSDSVTYSAILYPVFFFAITVVAFFFLTREIFKPSLGEKKSSIIALLASFFLSIFPILLPRTIAGIPEKESAAFFFMFLAFYFFLASWNSKKEIPRYLLAFLAGLSTAAMANIWGAYVYIYLGIAAPSLIAFLIGKVGKKETYTYSIWLFTSFIVIVFISKKFTINEIIHSTYISSSMAVLFIFIMYFVLFNTKIKAYLEKGYPSKIPNRATTLIISLIILFILSFVFFGQNFVANELSDLKSQLVKPATSRLIQTVAENKQPYFTEWSQSFGPVFRNIPITFWLFLLGSIYLFYFILAQLNKKDRILFTISYIYLLLALIFTRYSGNSTFNGENTISIFIYFSGFIVFALTILFYYYKYHKNNEFSKFESINFNLIFISIFSLFTIISARGLIRLVMLLAIPVSIIISYFAVSVFYDLRKWKESYKLFSWLIIGLVLLLMIFSGYTLYNQISNEAAQYAPATYNQQWQKAMAWVRDNTPSDSVFAHWWDYGYWVQSIGERATILDGGNLRSYWNHLMGRHVLTGRENKDALEFLYAHNATHLLIDSTDIGKYTAFSFIGSDKNLDRSSYLPSLLKDTSQTQENKNSTTYAYFGGTTLDDDLTYELDGKRIFLPSGKAGIGAVLIEKDSNGSLVSQPKGVYIYQNEQYIVPLRYIYDSKFIDFGSGAEAGVFIYPSASLSGGAIQNVDLTGAMFYLSNRTVKSQLARLYLYGEDNQYFKLAHKEDDPFIAAIKSQNPQFKSDFIYVSGFRGPIKIWEINYHSDIEFKEEYLSIEYPTELRLAK